MRHLNLRSPLLATLMLAVAFGAAWLPVSMVRAVRPAQDGFISNEVPRTPPDGEFRGLYSNFNNPRLAGPDEAVEVMIELEEPPAIEAFAREQVDVSFAGEGPVKAVAAARAQIARIERSQQKLVAALANPHFKAKITLRVQRVYNGIAVQVASGKLAEIRALPGIKAVHISSLIYPATDTSVPFIGAPQVWGSTVVPGQTGEGVVIAVIDSGIDYTHANLGGSGSATVFNSNNPIVIGDIADFPNAKVTGGVDLVGDSYNAADPNNNTPNPDPDPIDCKGNGHGTGTAGIAAGVGVNLNGTAYNGIYVASTNFLLFRIGPGVAPKANLYAIRAFGCNPLGATSNAVMTQAIDRALDPNQDGNFSDRARVVLIPGGGPFTTLPNSPVITAINNGAQLNVNYVGASGNGGDTFLAAGGPSLAAGALSVVATADNGLFNQNIRVTSPAQAIYPGAVTEIGSPLSVAIAANVVYASPPDGCSALTNATQMAGRIALVDRGTCSSTTKVRNAQAAGAVVTLIANNTATLPVNVFDDGTGSDVIIPSFLLAMNGADVIKQQLAGGATVSATITPGDVTPLSGLANTFATFNPYGGVYASNILKPDIGAPGINIGVARVGTGNAYSHVSGTSFAAPHVAGAAALLVQKNLGATTQEVYSKLRSTGKKAYCCPSDTPPEHGPSTVGGGALDAELAALLESFVRPVPGFIEAQLYGDLIQVPFPQTIQRGFTFAYRGVSPKSYQVLHNFAGIPGYTVTIPVANGTVQPNENKVISYNATINPSQLKRTCSPWVSLTQAGNARHCLPEVQGYISVEVDNKTVRFPVYDMVRPASEMGTSQTSLNLPGATGSFTLNLTGQGVNNGPSAPADWRSLVSPLELQWIDPDDQLTPSELDYFDIENVGVRSNFKTAGGIADTRITFGISTYGDWGSPNQVRFNVFIDTNRDGQYDFHLFNWSFPNAQGGPSDVHVSRLFNINTGVFSPQTFFLNAFSPATIDTAVFYNNVITLVTSAATLGLTEANSKFDYQVKTSFGNVAVDESARLTYDAINYGLDYGTSTMFNDLNGGTIPVTYNLNDFRTANSEGALLLHHLNTQGNRAQVLPANLGLEGDVDGDGDVDDADWILEVDTLSGKFLVNSGSDFQRTDTAKRETGGDGKLTIIDGIQTGRFSKFLDPHAQAGGPYLPIAQAPFGSASAGRSNAKNSQSQARTLRAVNGSFTQGQTNTLDIEIDALGGENGVGFSLSFDPAVLSFVSAAVGSDLPGASLFGVNDSQAAIGRLGLATFLPPGQGLVAGTRRIARISFTLVAGSTAPSTGITFTDLPLAREVGNVNADVVATGFASAQIALIRIAAHVSSASFTGASLASESIVSAFGIGLATRTEVGATIPLPQQLGGTTVRVKDSAGAERLASLFFVSAGQVNYAVPAGTALGMAVITITAEDGAVSTANVPIEAVAPGIFAANSNAQGVAAAQVLRVKADGSQVFESVAVFDPGSNGFIAAPIDLGPPTEQVFLILFGTGGRKRSTLSAVQLVVGGTTLAVQYFGEQGAFVGLDQLNALIPRSLIGRGQVEIGLVVDGKPANVVHIGIL